ncbi:MAG: DUF21 domain-containing protein [Chitinispirillaceae bacterium]|nr:DUF21 domain-containing protein [Chitinispirillaceae bacterium]
MPIPLQLLLLTAGVIGAAFFAGSETGFVSWNPLKVSHRAANGDIVARWAQFLLKHKDRLLSAQLIGNNVCIVGASLAFASLVATVDQHVQWNLEELPSPESWVLTPLMVLFGEMLPKSLFRMYPFRLTMRSIPMLMGIYFLTLPFTWMFTSVTGLFRRNTPAKGESFMTKVREEMVLVAMEGSRTGTLFRSADQFIQNVLLMNEKKTGDVFSALKQEDRDGIHNCFDGNSEAGAVKRRVDDGEGILVRDGNGGLYGYVAMHDLAAAPDTVTIDSLSSPLPRLATGMTIPAAIRLLDVKVPFVMIQDTLGTALGVIATATFLRGALRGS